MSALGAEATTERTGTTAFGKYQLFASLGRGGMADVFLSVARGQMGVDKLAVVKRLRRDLAGEAVFRDMFLDEARIAARLGHPNIVHTYEAGEQDGEYYMGMEYLEGQSLNKVLKESVRHGEVISPDVSVRIVTDALAGLGYAHELRDYDGEPLSIIHRDVSPHNIFVTYEGHTKLLDFGIAKAALSSTRTEVGVLKGKLAYMSPEQAMGLRIDSRSDLFAMGVVLWEMLAQRRLLVGESAASTLHNLINEPIPRLSVVLPGIDPDLESVVARSLEKDPQARWQSAAEMREALEAWLCARPRPARQEEVRRTMIALFGPVREQMQRQVRKHMAAVTSTSSARAPNALTAEASIGAIDASAVNESGHRLHVDAARSGVRSSYPERASGPESPADPHPRPARTHRSARALLVALALGAPVVAALCLFPHGLRGPSRASSPHGAITSVGSVEPSASEPTDDDDDRAATSTAPAADPPTAAPAATPIAVSTPALPSAHSTPLKTRVQAPLRAVPPSRSSPAPPAAGADEPGLLTVSSYPWARVTEGSRIICSITPCNKVQMSPGLHSITFESGEQPGQKQTVTVMVRPGETATKSVGFK